MAANIVSCVANDEQAERFVKQQNVSTNALHRASR